MPTERLSLEATWKHLRKADGFDIPRARGNKPKLIDHHAGVDRKSDPVDITFFKSLWEDTDLSNLTFPRRHINRTGMTRVSFRNTDLNQSFLCWNDFIECDFTDADLTCCDLRASVFEGCSFVRCKLIGADLRGSSFEGCDFTAADLTGAKVWIDDEDMPTDDWQFAQIVMCDDNPEPRGG